MNNKPIKILLAIVVGFLLVAAFATYVSNRRAYDLIDCEAIYEKSREDDFRGVATNYVPIVIQKCFSD